MNKAKLEKLLPFFAYTYSKKLNPERYGSVGVEDWVKLIDKYPADEAQIIQAANQLSQDDWDKIESEYDKMSTGEQQEGTPEAEETTYAKKGAKLNHLKKLKSSRKKCGCGCDLILHKEGGKIVEKCACGCSTKNEASSKSMEKVRKVTAKMMQLKPV